VICGFGRTGEWWGSQTYGMQPHLITFAKAVTNGYMPLGGVLISDKVADVLLAGGGEFAHGLTYSGHPASCAAGLATLQILEEEHRGARRASTCALLPAEAWHHFPIIPIVGQVRGRGCFAAIELVRDKETRERLAPESVAAVFCRDTANNANNHGADGAPDRRCNDHGATLPLISTSRAY
jgi:putrescine aminotransferase